MGDEKFTAKKKRRRRRAIKDGENIHQRSAENGGSKEGEGGGRLPVIFNLHLPGSF